MNLKSSSAREFELHSSLFTWHPFMEKQYSQRLSNKQSSSGRLITNGLYALKWSEHNDTDYKTISLFTGENSVNTNMSGISYSSGSIYRYLLFGYIAGLYIQDESEFDNRSIRSAHIIRTGQQGITPVLGLEIGVKFPISHTISIKQLNVITPVITNHSIGIAIDF